MTFTDFKQMQPTTTLKTESVLDYVELLCQVLRTNYQTYAIQLHRDSIAKDDNVEYHKKKIDELSEGVGVNEFIYEKGRKYAKILHIDNPGGSKSAHMFVDMVTGDCFKPASYKSPAKGIRYNLLDDNSREEMLLRADWVGSYLYLR